MWLCGVHFYFILFFKPVINSVAFSALLPSLQQTEDCTQCTNHATCAVKTTSSPTYIFFSINSHLTQFNSQIECRLEEQHVKRFQMQTARCKWANLELIMLLLAHTWPECRKKNKLFRGLSDKALKDTSFPIERYFLNIFFYCHTLKVC